MTEKSTLERVSNRCFAEVPFELGASQVVKFDDDEMQVRVHNPEGRQGELSFCFEASPDTVTSKCPQGYAQLHVSLNHHQKEVTYKVHRQGYLKLNPPLIEGKMKFREDGSIKVMAAEHSNAMSVSLVNAKVYFPGEELADELKESFSTGSVLHWVVFGLIALAVKILIVIGCYYHYYKRRLRLQASSTTTGNRGELVSFMRANH